MQAQAPVVNKVEDTDHAVQQKFYEQMLTVAAGSIERSRDSAKFIQVAAAAIGTLYTGALGLMFAVKENPLPTRGLIPTLFFGGAVVLAAWYLAYLTDEPAGPGPVLSGVAKHAPMERVSWFTGWVGRVIANRASAIRASVVSLSVGIVLLPVAVVQFPAPGSSDTGTANTVTPTTAIEWPEPPTIADTALASVLYEAELAEFRENLPDAKSGAVPTNRIWIFEAEELVAWLAALIGASFVLRQLRGRWL